MLKNKRFYIYTTYNGEKLFFNKDTYILENTNNSVIFTNDNGYFKTKDNNYLSTTTISNGIENIATVSSDKIQITTEKVDDYYQISNKNGLISFLDYNNNIIDNINFHIVEDINPIKPVIPIKPDISINRELIIKDSGLNFVLLFLFTIIIMLILCGVIIFIIFYSKKNDNY